MLNFLTYTHEKHHEWVVFIHGAGGSIKTWSYQVEHFKPHFNLLLIDLRDHGQSKNLSPKRDSYDFALISSDIKQVLDFLNITKAHFVTLSFGSVLLQDMAMRYPQMIDKVVFAGGIFRGNFLIRSFVHLARLMNVFLSYTTMYRLFSYLLMPRKRNQKARRLYQMQARRLTTREYLKWVGLYGEFFKLLDQFFYQELERPTLILMGSDDYIFLSSAQAFSMKQHKSSMGILENAGHICNIEKPGEFNDVVLEFLQQVYQEDQTPDGCPNPVHLDQLH